MIFARIEQCGEFFSRLLETEKFDKQMKCQANNS
jgi:hypothetical protein